MAKISKWEIRFKRIYNWKMPIIMLHERINRRPLFPASFFEMQAVRIRSFKIQNSTSQNCFVRNGYDLKWSTNWPRQLFFSLEKAAICRFQFKYWGDAQYLNRCRIKPTKTNFRSESFLERKLKWSWKRRIFSIKTK